VLLALGWSGAHFDIAKRFMTLWRGALAAGENYLVTTPAPTPESLDPAAQPVRGNILPGLSSDAPSEGPADQKDPNVPQQSGVRSKLLSREPN
jgi:hypothetical protein